MFAYCRSNPVNRMDALGTDDICATSNEDDNDPLNDAGYFRGGGGGAGGNSGYSNSGTNGNYQVGGNGWVDGSSRVNGSVGTNVNGHYHLNTARTEIHHIVEQCQQYKSGFSRADIQADSNLIELPYAVHRKISGHYSSKMPYTDRMRVRDWLAGQSFEAQTRYGWEIVRRYLGG